MPTDFLGSDETNDRRCRPTRDTHVGTANVIHVSGPRIEASPSVHAVRHRGAVAAPSATSKRRNTVDYGGFIPCKRAFGVRCREVGDADVCDRTRRSYQRWRINNSILCFQRSRLRVPWRRRIPSRAIYNVGSMLIVTLHFEVFRSDIRHIVFIQVKTDEEEQLFAPQMPTVVALSKGCKSAQVVRDAADVPAGCGSAVVTPTIIVHTLVRVRAFGFLVSFIGRDLFCVSRALWI